MSVMHFKCLLLNEFAYGAQRLALPAGGWDEITPL
jgi:hypothetical protein